MKRLAVHIDPIEDDSHWITGNIGDGRYYFYAKLTDETTKEGINKGRITKLVLRLGDVRDDIEEEEFWDEVVANYDRTMIKEPITHAEIEAFNELVEYLGREVPKYKERIYEGSLLKQMVGKTKKALSINGV